VKERLESAKAGSTRGLGSPAGPGASFAYGGGAGSRIAKPLRGGGAVTDGPMLPPVIGSLQEDAGRAKRTSWFFNKQ
jgi:kinesin family protein 5